MSAIGQERTSTDLTRQCCPQGRFERAAHWAKPPVPTLVEYQRIFPWSNRHAAASQNGGSMSIVKIERDGDAGARSALQVFHGGDYQRMAPLFYYVAHEHEFRTFSLANRVWWGWNASECIRRARRKNDSYKQAAEAHVTPYSTGLDVCFGSQADTR